MSGKGESVKTESRLTVAGGLTANGQGKSPRLGDMKTLKLNCSDGRTTICSYKKSLNFTFKMGEFMVRKSYSVKLF